MYRIGIDLGGTFVKAGLVDENGKIIIKSKIPTLVKRDHAEVIDDMSAQAKKLCLDAGADFAEVVSVGIGCPGAITGTTGEVSYSCNLDWRNVPLGGMLSERLGKPVKVSNDANVAALGEALYGAGKNYSDIIMLTLGTGVGGGIVIGKKLYEGNESKGAELGHMVICSGGERCACGRRGCFEAYCSASALIRDTKRAMEKDGSSLMWEIAGGSIDGVNGETAFIAEKRGDKSAAEVIERYVFYLAEGIMNFCNIFRPQAIVLGGGVSEQGANLTDRVTELCRKGYYGYKGTPEVEILTATLKNDAGLIGAAFL